MKKKISLGICLAVTMSIIISNIAFASKEAVAPMKKTDDILVETDAVGNVISKKASVTIVGGDSSKTIRDKTILSDVSNISGEENFTQEEQGTLIWENAGKEINYIGTLKEDLPFSMEVKYYFNGQEIKPSELAGKSGHIEVIYSFENRATVEVNVDGETFNTYVPFLAVTSITLPKEGFQNIESLDGGLVVEEFGDTQFLLGVAAPGIAEALNLEIIGLDQYIQFPEKFGFSADVTNFKMPSTITSITPHALDKLDLSQIKVSDSVDTQIDELISATQKLMNGSSELAGGTSQLSDGVGQFAKELQNGLKQIADGSAKMGNELYDMESKKNAIQGQASEILEQLDSILEELHGFELPEADSIFTPEFMEAEEKLKEDAALLIAALETMKAQLEEIQAFAEEARVYVDQMTELGNTLYAELSAIDLDQMIDDATALAKEQAIKAAKEEFSGIPLPEEQLNSIINNIMSKIDISSVADEARVHIAKVEEALLDVPEIEIPEFQVDIDPVIAILQDMEAQFAVLETVADKKDEVTELLDSAHDFMDSVKNNSSELRHKSNELISGLDFADSAIKNAQDYINALRAAVSEANEGSAQLVDGVGRVDDGAKQLADGTKQYYTDGILKASDYARQATLKAFLTRCKSFVFAAREYTNISGIEKDATRGSVRFTIHTEPITVSAE